jgi:DNA polymerase-3 subunit gamma/tau
VQPQQQQQQQQQQTHTPPPMPEGQSGSTIADIEAGGGASCVTNCAEASVQDEVNGTDITKEPMVKTAIELFEAKKVTVQSKI